MKKFEILQKNFPDDVSVYPNIKTNMSGIYISLEANKAIIFMKKSSEHSDEIINDTLYYKFKKNYNNNKFEELKKDSIILLYKKEVDREVYLEYSRVFLVKIDNENEQFEFKLEKK